jgi:hypothetical protein
VYNVNKLIFFWFEKGVKVFFCIWVIDSEKAAGFVGGGGWGGGEFYFEVFAEVSGLSIANGICSGNDAVIGFAGRVVAAIGASVKIDATMRTFGSESDFNGDVADELVAFPTVHEFKYIRFDDFFLRQRRRKKLC